MGRLADGRVIHVEIAADRPDHYLSSVEPDPDLDGHAGGALDLRGIALDRGLHV